MIIHTKLHTFKYHTHHIYIKHRNSLHFFRIERFFIEISQLVEIGIYLCKSVDFRFNDTKELKKNVHKIKANLSRLPGNLLGVNLLEFHRPDRRIYVNAFHRNLYDFCFWSYNDSNGNCLHYRRYW